MNTILLITAIVMVCLWLTLVDPVGKQAKTEWNEFKTDYPEFTRILNKIKK